MVQMAGSFRNGCAIHQFAGALNGIADFGCRNKAGLFRRGISRKRYDVGPAEDVLENVLPLTFVINEFIKSRCSSAIRIVDWPRSSLPTSHTGSSWIA